MSTVSGLRSYHVSKYLGGHAFCVWPAASFGQYCTDEAIAREQFESEIKDARKNDVFELISYEAVVKDNQVVGVVRGSEIVSEKRTVD